LIFTKNIGVFKDKSYCDNIVKTRYEDFIKEEDDIHVYDDQKENNT